MSDNILHNDTGNIAGEGEKESAGEGTIESKSQPGSIEYFVENLGNGVELEMAEIPGGEFWMGDDNGDENAKPRHLVKVSAFFMGKFPVTQAQYQAIMVTNPSGSPVEERYPVQNINWDQSVEFCQELSQRKGKNYRLPSEAEREYACRAGTQTKYYFGDDQNQLGDHGWYFTNSNYDTHPVGEKNPNTFGLYDMYGNIWEWCSDRWHANYANAPTDGSIWNGGKPRHRVIRGGSWGNDAISCCSAIRESYLAVHREDYIGFRLVFA